MKMGNKDPRVSMSKSVKGKSPRGKGGGNPIKSASPAETPAVGHGTAPKRTTTPAPDAVADEHSIGD